MDHVSKSHATSKIQSTLEGTGQLHYQVLPTCLFSCDFDCKLLCFSQVQVAAFHNNLDLRVVDLSNNPHLTEVKPFAFPRILHLSHLSLARTNVTTLRSDAVPWERLGFLDLAGKAIIK